MRTITAKRKIAALGLTSVMTLSLAGCFGDDEAGTGPTTSPTPTPEMAVGGSVGQSDDNETEDPEPAEQDPESEAETEPEPEAEPEPEPETGGLDGAECLHGTWLADNDTALAGMREFGDQIKSVEGAVYVEYREDGTFTSDYQDWTISAHEQGVDVTVHRHGTDHGSFTATDTTITQSDEDMGAVITMTSAGMEMEVPAAPWTYTDAPYTCSESELVITTADGDGVLTR